MLELAVEWDERAPWVRAPALATTWGKLEIRAGDQLVTRFWHAPSNSVRTGVHASMFPFARWVVSNWWNLLHERMPAPEVLNGARRTALLHRTWLERHNLFLSREGMAYPDLSVYREDEMVGVRWVADPEGVTTAGRFLDGGFVRIDVKQAEATLAQFVDAVIERLPGTEDLDSNQLRADWDAVQNSLQEEPRLCARLGEMGLDPYDADADESLEGELEALVLSEPVIADLLAFTTPQRFKQDVSDVQLFLDQLRSGLPRGNGKRPQRRFTAPFAALSYFPYRAGYARAEAVRRSLHLAPFVAAEREPTLVAELTVGTFDLSEIPAKENRRLDAVVSYNGVPALSAEQRSSRATRFLLARALHHWIFVEADAPGPRLLTRASDWQQAASRAFAAELLAPAAALAERMEGRADWDAVEKLADLFEVQPFVIHHQLSNHGLA
ncbi:MAG: hypothetical protein E6J91_17415 [Deltaproteobacteria bacterium]|nr:MAG: hypothetical protein E6J91_17415 [Deltaproteobacteria bacterium]